MSSSASEPARHRPGACLRRLAGRPPGPADLEQELEEARRLGHWFTEEDRQLLREHEARLASERRGALLRRAGRGGALTLMVASTALPLLWPVAIVAGVRAFPATSRRLGLILAIGAGAGVLTTGVVVSQLSRALLAPAAPPAEQPLARAAASPPETTSLAEPAGRDLAARLESATDYWLVEGRAADGSITLRKGLVQQHHGEAVMVLPRSSWALLSASQRRSLADHMASERNVRAIHVGQVVTAREFEGNTIRVQERVWPEASWPAPAGRP